MKIHIIKGNKKLPTTTLNFSLPPIVTCPKATVDCKKWCYSLKAWRQYPNVRKAWTENYKLSQTKYKFKRELLISLSKFKKWNTFRIHVAGDFYSQEYLNKWFDIINQYNKTNSNKIFYAYTKMYNLDYRDKPYNFIILYSNDNTTIHPTLLFKFDGVASVEEKGKIYKGHFKCPMDCRKCNYCYTKEYDKDGKQKFKGILFKRH